MFQMNLATGSVEDLQKLANELNKELSVYLSLKPKIDSLIKSYKDELDNTSSCDARAYGNLKWEYNRLRNLFYGVREA